MKARVEDLMTTKYVKVMVNDKISKVMSEIAQDRETMIACVVDEDGKLRGIITPRRLLKAVQMSSFSNTRDSYFAWEEALSSMTAKYAEDLMGPVISVTPNYSINDTIDLMLDKSLYELPVLDQSGRMLGEINFFHIIMSWAKGFKKRQLRPQSIEHIHWLKRVRQR
ncbi:CBS domain-containing protein [Chloroflexota bacterium]